MVWKMTETNEIEPNETTDMEKEQIKGLKITVNELQLKQNELDEKLKTLEKKYKSRETDLLVLGELVKEKTVTLEEMRDEKKKTKKKLLDLKAAVAKNIEEGDITQKRIESLQAEKKAIKNSLEKYKTEINHANNLIEKKDNELTLLNNKIQSKKEKKQGLNEEIELLNKEIKTLNKMKESSINAYQEFQNNITNKQDLLISLDSYLKKFLELMDETMEKKLERSNFLKFNQEIEKSMKKYIDKLNEEYNEKIKEMESLNAHFDKIDGDIKNISEFRDDISNMLGINRNILDKLFRIEKE